MPDRPLKTSSTAEAPLAFPLPARADDRQPLPLIGIAHPRLLLVAGLLAFATSEVVAGTWDAEAVRAAASVPMPHLQVWKAVTVFGLSGYMFALSGGLAAAAWLTGRCSRSADRRVRCSQLAWRSAYVFASVAVAGLGAQAIKHLTGRMRPAFLSEVGAFDWVGPSLRSGADSFPSGHTTSAFAAAVALALLMPRMRGPLLGAAVLVGVSRVMVGSHYPTDVLAGATLGTGTAWCLATAGARHGWVFRRAGFDRQPRPTLSRAHIDP